MKVACLNHVDREIIIYTCDYRVSRRTFDTSETQKEIGPVIIQFGKVGVFHVLYEWQSEKTGLQGFRPGLAQTDLCSHRRWLGD